MTASTKNLHNKNRRRVIFISASFLAVLAVGGLGLSVFAKICDAVDRMH